MRNLAFASLVIVDATLGACSAVDDFRKFKFTDGGSIDTDMMGNLPGFSSGATPSTRSACAPHTRHSQAAGTSASIENGISNS